MKRIICLISAFLAVSFASCEYLEDPAQEDLPIVVKKIIETTEGDPVPSIVRYTYDISQILRADYEGGNANVFIYESDLLVRVNILNSENVLRSIYTYGYDESQRSISALFVSPTPNQGILTTYVYNADGSISATQYSGTANQQDELMSSGTIYIGANGEIASHQQTTADGTFTTTYTYDDKNNPQMNILGFNRLLTPGRRYNVISAQIHDEAGNFVSENYYTWTYNEEFFPIVSVRTGSGQPALTTEYFYE